MRKTRIPEEQPKRLLLVHSEEAAADRDRRDYVTGSGSDIDLRIASYRRDDRFVYLPDGSEWTALSDPFEREERGHVQACISVGRGTTRAGKPAAGQTITHRNADQFRRLPREGEEDE